MQLTFLGHTGLRVSTFCLGTMTFGTNLGWGADEATSLGILDRYADAGGNFIDTANAYTQGASETMLGRFLRGRRDRFVLASKYTISTDKTHPNAGGNHRRSLQQALEASLRRLATDCIDLYWVHMWDGFTPVEETMRALDDAVRAGKILYVGLSDFPAWLVADADTYAGLRGLTRPAAIQVEYNVAFREAERELLPMASAHGMSVLDWSPLGGGALTGKMLEPASAAARTSRVGSGAVARISDKYQTPARLALIHKLQTEARELGCTAAQLALAWLRQRGDCHIPIIGARSIAQIESNLALTDWRMPADCMARLDAAGEEAAGFPLDFLRAGLRDWQGEQMQRLDPRTRPAQQALMGIGQICGA